MLFSVCAGRAGHSACRRAGRESYGAQPVAQSCTSTLYTRAYTLAIAHTYVLKDTYKRPHTRVHKRVGVGVGGVATAEAAATRRLPTTIYNLYADIDFEAGLYFLNLCKLAALLCGARI